MNIKTLSPFYISVPLVNPNTDEVCESFTVKLYVWNGLKTARPAEPAYQITKTNASATSGDDKINVARIVNDYIEFSCTPQTTTTLVNGANQVWVKFECFYDSYLTEPSIETIYLGVKGYGLFLEGENPQLPNTRLLLTGDEFKVNRGGRFVMPLLAQEPAVSPRVITLTNVVYTNILLRGYEFTFTANFPYTSLTAQLRNTGSTEWSTPIPFSTTILNTAYLTEDVFSEFEVRISSYDQVTQSRIYSNVLTVQPLQRVIQIPNHNITGSPGSKKLTAYWEVNYTGGIVKAQYKISGSWFTMPDPSQNPYVGTSTGTPGAEVQFRLYDTVLGFASETITFTL